MLQLGCVTMLSKRARRRPLGEGFSLDELEMRTTTEFPYCVGGRGGGAGTQGTQGSQGQAALAFRYVVVYQSESDARGVTLLMAPHAGRCLAVVTQPGRGTRDVGAGLLRRALRAAREEGEAGPETADLEVSVEYVRKADDAVQRVAQALQDIVDSHRGPTVALVESPRGARELQRLVPALQGLPVVAVPHNNADGQYPALGWQAEAARLAVRRAAVAGPWLRERVALAAYAHVPLGNFGPDWVVTVADAFFGRVLRDANHVLWASPNGQPDLGGGQLDQGSAQGWTDDDDPPVEARLPSLTFSFSFFSAL